MFPQLTPAQVDMVVEAVKEVVGLNDLNSANSPWHSVAA
jgi:hypothetical protein